MKLHVLDLGTILMKRSNEVTLGESNEEPRIPIHGFLIESPIGNILFDTGCNPYGMRGEWPEELTGNPFEPPGGNYDILMDSIRACGIEPEDVSILVSSHLHMDHAGAIHRFPWAKVYVQKDELEVTMKHYEEGTLDLFHEFHDIDHMVKAGISWIPVRVDSPDREYRLCDGITLLDLKSGHSDGLLGMLVELQSGNLLLAGDTIYSEEHFGPPARMAGICTDEKGYFDTIEFLRRYAEDHDAKILYGHDMKQFRSLEKIYE